MENNETTREIKRRNKISDEYIDCVNIRRELLEEGGISYETLVEHMIRRHPDMKQELVLTANGVKDTQNINGNEQRMLHTRLGFERLFKEKGRWPSYEELAIIAEATHTNIAYVLGLTDARTADDTYIINFDLDAIRIREGYNKGDFAAFLDTSTTTLCLFRNNGVMGIRLRNILYYCEKLDCSIDYILGLTSQKNWSNYNLFVAYEAGSPLHVITGTIDANCVLSDDRKFLYFSNGTNIKTADIENATIYKFKELTGSDKRKTRR